MDEWIKIQQDEKKKKLEKKREKLREKPIKITEKIYPQNFQWKIFDIRILVINKKFKGIDERGSKLIREILWNPTEIAQF